MSNSHHYALPLLFILFLSLENALFLLCTVVVVVVVMVPDQISPSVFIPLSSYISFLMNPDPSFSLPCPAPLSLRIDLFCLRFLCYHYVHIVIDSSLSFSSTRPHKGMALLMCDQLPSSLPSSFSHISAVSLLLLFHHQDITKGATSKKTNPPLPLIYLL